MHNAATYPTCQEATCENGVISNRGSAGSTCACKPGYYHASGSDEAHVHNAAAYPTCLRATCENGDISNRGNLAGSTCACRRDLTSQ